MKTITDTETTIENEGSPLSYFDLAGVCLNDPSTAPKGGFDVQTMGLRIDILKALNENKGGEAQLEDAQFAELQGAVANRKWPALHPEVHAFMTYIGGIK